MMSQLHTEMSDNEMVAKLEEHRDEALYEVSETDPSGEWASKDGAGESLINDILGSDEVHQNVAIATAEAMTEIAIETEHEFNNWSHSVCHLFESYSRSPEDSLLQEQYLEAAEVLVNEAVTRATTEGWPGQDNILRMLSPLPDYNFDNFESAEEWAVRPEALDRHGEELFELFKEEGTLQYASNSFDLEAYMRSDTPQEMIEQYIDQGEPLSHNDLTILQQARSYIGNDEMSSYLAEAYGVEADPARLDREFERLEANVQRASYPDEKVSGTFVDVDGTLIQDGSLNEEIYQEMEERRDDEIFSTPTIYTGGSSVQKTLQLRELGVDKEYLPVESKSGYRGKLLTIVIDDTQPAMQGFAAKHYKHPDEFQEGGS